MIVFNGIANAALQEEKVRVAVQQIAVKPQVGAVLFVEDAGSRLYTRLKQEAAERIGIGYRVYEFSVKDPVEKVLQKIIELNTDPVITGIIIQKPTRALWQSHLETEQGSEKKNGFSEWWSRLVSSIDEAKDVDGLHPQTLKMIEAGTWQEQGRVLPATCQAVIDILGGYCEISEKSRPENQSELDHLQCLKNKKIIILGKSDLLGKPLYYYLHNLGFNVDMFGSSELRERIEAGRALTDADVLISATGRAGLITETMIKEGVAVVDVGEPRADVEFESVSKKASFITPVPGGVGPMTVVCLMENALRLVRV